MSNTVTLEIVSGRNVRLSEKQLSVLVDIYCGGFTLAHWHERADRNAAISLVDLGLASVSPDKCFHTTRDGDRAVESHKYGRTEADGVKR